MSVVNESNQILQPPQPIKGEHQFADFNSGNAELDEWLQKRALKNEDSGASRTYVVTVEQTVIASYCLANGSVLNTTAPGRIRRNMPESIPVMVIGRLAVDLNWQGKGIGRALVRDAVLRTLQAADIAGIRAILVHAISEEAKQFYERCGFIASPVATMTLMVMVKDAKAALG
ncbi:GNAT family N-acetyltransferase [Nostoc sp. FACHB-152]|uniref:GNAT family N-acetyltransferase n=1 Tax=unclassified Nostoc TaxID=2593658 RepID=UPI001689EF7B|nr:MULTISPECIES: GNAT family N-acetyltransferase [unclassified Nostoc]MBD2452066.1 GNAT family N-acetyltransferase [Nostoc sp. FACHB-152]MBD2472635.1 GNAT family N-acetyltransferase [Nostoc sp. FACHB-145]